MSRSNLRQIDYHELTPDALASLAAGDSGAFGELYRRFNSGIAAYCHREIRQAELAEDASSETFERAWRAIARFRGGSFQRWLFCIAHNVIVDTHRRTRTTSDLALVERIPSTMPPIEEVTIARVVGEHIEHLLLSLTPDQTTVIRLRIAGLNGNEIAGTLNRRRSWVDVTAHRALERPSKHPDMIALMREVNGDAADKTG